MYSIGREPEYYQLGREPEYYQLGEMCSDPSSGKNWLCLNGYYSLGSADDVLAKVQQADIVIYSVSDLSGDAKNKAFDQADAILKSISNLGASPLYIGNTESVEDYNMLSPRLKAIVISEIAENIDWEDNDQDHWQDKEDVKNYLFNEYKVHKSLTQSIMNGNIDSNMLSYILLGGGALSLGALLYWWLRR